jgi:membrane protease YdiL (CAAX protease family)
MRRYHSSYLGATRHPWPCLLFLLPLLIIYEAGVLRFGGTHPDALRNGADTWLRWGLESFGLTQLYCAPVLIGVVFFAWSVLRFWDRPEGVAGICAGMAAESVLFALGLWALSREIGPFLDQMGIKLSLNPDDNILGRLVTFVGAGIYEEALFRLALFFILGRLLRFLWVSSLVAAPLTMISSALLFSAAHHIGPFGEAFNSYVFLFRFLAGLYFAMLYQLRGFGIAVGTHAFYDVLVGVLVT